MFNKRTARKLTLTGPVLLAGASLGVAFGLIECLLSFLLLFPPLLTSCPRPIMTLVRHLYLNIDRSIVQFQRHLAQYDPELFYTLRPGISLFENREYGVPMEINSKGLRDSEASLQHPVIIALGDSFTMGWGVEGERTFPKRLEQKLNLRVLNAGISSYGTVRERRLLDRVDSSNLKLLLIQYCDNDYTENEDFYQKDNQLVAQSEGEYEKALSNEKRRLRYYPGKFAWYAFTFLFSKILPSSFFFREAFEPALELRYKRIGPVRAFLNALMYGGVTDLSSVQLLFIHLEGRPLANDPFLEALRKAIRSSDLPHFIRKMALVDFSHALSPDDYFVLDDHLNGRGHASVTEKLVHEIATHLH